jgi:hypothetical protein
VMPSWPYAFMEAMPYTGEGWEWECPATVISIVDGKTFYADIDLGWNVHVRAYVVCKGIEVDDVTTPDGLAAKKEAQRLLKDANLLIHCHRLIGHPATSSQAAVCTVRYSPFFEPRSEQGSFAAAMLASGFARKKG